MRDLISSATINREPIYVLRLLAVISNLIVPGVGLIQRGRWRLACMIQLLLFTLTLSLCWSRWVFEPVAIQLFFALIGVVYLFSTALCLSTTIFSADKPIRLLALSGIFFVISLAGFTAGFFFKQYWLGVHIYFVPSMSMYPTLNPGQFILLDTWTYQAKAPQLNDIVVFQHSKEDQWLVKRISKWPDDKLQHNGLWYMLGDNRKASLDSRNFGGIENTQIVGQVKMVLLEINQNYQLESNSILQTTL